MKNDFNFSKQRGELFRNIFKERMKNYEEKRKNSL